MYEWYLTYIFSLQAAGMDMNSADYDGRTALHLACAEGHLNVVKLLVEQFHVNTSPLDRWVLMM